KSVLALLEERGLVNQIAGDRNALNGILQRRKVGFYAGIDPTAPSLHLGHLLPLMVLFWMHRSGHHVVSLVGRATAQVGDPSGRLTSRAKTAETVHQTNFQTMYAQLGLIWNNATLYAQRRGGDARGLKGTMELLDNGTWLNELRLLDFLKLLGGGMRLGSMLSRDTVRNKMEKGDGMSFSEFTYPLLQAWDWWHMYRSKSIQVQIGGSDQFGNIIAGMDAVRHIAQTSTATGQQFQWLDEDGKLKDEYAPMGLTVPLLTTSSGEKFGKSAGNAVWLDGSMTSPFDLYGFLLRSADDDVERYIKLFTFVPIDEIASVMAAHMQNPGERKAQHLLASEVLELVHGREEAERTQREHHALRSPTLSALKSKSQDGSEHASAQTVRIVLPASLVYNTPFSRILFHAGIVPTKSEGARLVQKGGAYVGGSSANVHGLQPGGTGEGLSFSAIGDQKTREVKNHVNDGLLIIRVGKWKVRVIEVVEDAAFEAKGLDAPGW
ncbi:hypothetical protein BAUCODRAFT_59578, partial [Baudoinia panamericana UAMH 10762]